MKKDRSYLIYAMIVLLVAAVYSLILFTLKREFSLSAWIAYGYTMLAFLFLIIGSYMPGGDKKSYPMLGVPLAASTAVYFAAQFLLGGVIVMAFDSIDPLLTLIAGLVLFVAYLLVYYGIFAVRSAVEAQDEHVDAKVSSLRLLKADLDVIAAQAKDEALVKNIAALAETVRYSDPMSQEALSDLEERIRANVTMLREHVEEGDVQKAQSRVEKLRVLIDERNAKCAALK